MSSRVAGAFSIQAVGTPNKPTPGLVTVALHARIERTPK